MFFLLGILFDLLDSVLKPLLIVAAAVLIAQMLGIDVIGMAVSFAEQQLKTVVSPF